MPGKPAVQVVIAGDTKDLDKALKHSSGALKTFGGTAAGVFGGLAIAKGIGLAVDGIKALGGFVGGGIDKLDALGDSMARLDGLAKGLGSTAQAADLSRFGVDKGEQAAAALSIAKTGKALKLTGQQTKTIVPNLQKMSAQLASLGDGDVAGQADLIAKALGGSSKAAKALGVVLPKGGTALQNYQALMKQLGPQLDKATSGQASLADVGERWDATLANLQLQLAGFLEKLAPVVSTLLDMLLPVLQKLVDEIGPQVATFFGGLAEAFAGFVAGGGAQKVSDIFGTIAGILGRLVAFVNDNLVPAFAAIAGAIVEAIGPLLPKIQEVADKLFPVLQRFADFFTTVIVPVLVNVVIPALGKLLGFFLDIAAAFLEHLGPAIDGLADAFDGLMDFLKPVLDALGTIADLAGSALGSIGNIHLPFLASSPAGASSRSGAPVNVTIQTGVGDPVAIGRQVARYLAAYQLRGGTVQP